MSRKVTNILHKLVNAATLPMTERIRFKTKSGLISKLHGDLKTSVKTPRGTLKLFADRGKNMAAAVSGFETDEPEMLAWIDTIKPGETLWDIGANIGLYTLYATQRKDIVIYAFEPNGLNFGIMIEHLMLNGLDKYAKALCVAFADKTNLGELCCSDAEVGQAGNNLQQEGQKNISLNANSFFQTVPVFSIDDFCRIYDLPAPDHIKLDVDGLEDVILRGGPQTLSRIKSLIIEIEGDEARRQNLLDLVLKTGLKEVELPAKGGKGRNRLFTRA